MVRTSVLNDALKSMNNAEKAGKRQVMIRPSSKVIIKVLQTMQKHGMSVPDVHVRVSENGVSLLPGNNNENTRARHSA